MSYLVMDRSYREIPYRTMKFPGGEIQVRLEGGPETPDTNITIQGNAGSSDDLFELALLVDALRRRYGCIRLKLTMPYLPYARQDRVCEEGEALSIVVLANFINALEFERVEIWDAHSDVALALIDNVVNVPQHELVKAIAVPDLKPGTILVSPDAGAVKKCMAVARATGLKMIEATKHRDPKDGKITGTSVNINVPYDGYSDFLIVDDILDGGRTFIELAKVLGQWTKGRILLYVTHSIFSQGIAPVAAMITRTYVANPLFTKQSRDEYRHFVDAHALIVRGGL